MLSGSTVDHVPVEAAALVVAALGVVLLRRAPRVAFAGWLVAVCFLPVWAGIKIKVDLEPHVLASVGLLVCLLPVAARRRGVAVGRFSAGDVLCLGFVLVSLVPLASGRTTFSDLFVLLVQWMAAFLVGRLIGYRLPISWVYGAVAVGFTIVAVLTLVECLTGFNPFVHIPGQGALHETWASIQFRGGRARAEGAFGSSIALGSSLALAIPLALAAPFRTWLRVAMVLLMLAAATVTFSRDGLLTAALGVVLAVLFMGRRLPAGLRVAVLAGLTLVVAALWSQLDAVFAEAGAEAGDSAGYRLALLQLLPKLLPFGYASSAYKLPDGQLVLATVQSADGTLHSIDNALLLIGLTYGWVPLAFLVALLILGLGCLLSGRATAPTIAVLAQIPAFVSVALITQYATVVWFVAGLAVFTQSVSGARRSAQPVEDCRDLSPEMVDAGPGIVLPLRS